MLRIVSQKNCAIWSYTDDTKIHLEVIQHHKCWHRLVVLLSLLAKDHTNFTSA